MNRSLFTVLTKKKLRNYFVQKPIVTHELTSIGNISPTEFTAMFVCFDFYKVENNRPENEEKHVNGVRGQKDI